MITTTGSGPCFTAIGTPCNKGRNGAWGKAVFHDVLALLIAGLIFSDQIVHKNSMSVQNCSYEQRFAHLVGWELGGVANQVSKGAHQQPREFRAHSADGAVLAGIRHRSRDELGKPQAVVVLWGPSGSRRAAAEPAGLRDEHLCWIKQRPHQVLQWATEALRVLHLISLALAGTDVILPSFLLRVLKSGQHLSDASNTSKIHLR